MDKNWDKNIDKLVRSDSATKLQTIACQISMLLILLWHAQSEHKCMSRLAVWESAMFTPNHYLGPSTCRIFTLSISQKEDSWESYTLHFLQLIYSMNRLRRRNSLGAYFHRLHSFNPRGLLSLRGSNLFRIGIASLQFYQDARFSFGERRHFFQNFCLWSATKNQCVVYGGKTITR